MKRNVSCNTAYIALYYTGLSVKLKFLFLVISRPIHACPAFSTLQIWSRVFQSRVFSVPNESKNKLAFHILLLSVLCRTFPQFSCIVNISLVLSCMYVCIFLQHENSTQNIMPEGQQGLKALTAARNKNVSIKYWHQLTI